MPHSTCTSTCPSNCDLNKLICLSYYKKRGMKLIRSIHFNLEEGTCEMIYPERKLRCEKGHDDSKCLDVSYYD